MFVTSAAIHSATVMLVYVSQKLLLLSTNFYNLSIILFVCEGYM